MNNKPVAWMFQGAFDISTYVSFEKPNPDIYPNPIPLYTHPAKETLNTRSYLIGRYDTSPVKDLTNEEIGEFTHRMVLCCGVHPNSADINVLGLKFIVEEILRKAQE